jgi:hypothetical protein
MTQEHRTQETLTLTAGRCGAQKKQRAKKEKGLTSPCP